MESLSEDERLVLDASSMANWSLVGVIMPAVGWVLGVKVLNKIKYWAPGDHKDKVILQSIRAKARWGIILSTLSFIIAAATTVLINYASYTQRKSAADSAIRQDTSSSQYYCDPEFYEC